MDMEKKQIDELNRQYNAKAAGYEDFLKEIKENVEYGWCQCLNFEHNTPIEFIDKLRKHSPLINAAPAMLEALKEAVIEIEFVEKDNNIRLSCLEKIEAAIKKATEGK